MQRCFWLVAAAVLAGCTPQSGPEQPQAQAAAPAQGTRPVRINGHPNLNGIWLAMNTANWNLEGHSAQAIDEWWATGALAGVPAGESVVVGGTIPYLPAALEKRNENRAAAPDADPETACYMPGVPRANYQPFPFQIVQGDGNLQFIYSFAKANRVIHVADPSAPKDVPVDFWMGWSNGHWDGDTLVVDVFANDDRTWLDRAGNHHSAAMKVTERYTLVDDSHVQYEATIEDPNTFSQPWTISMPLYRRIESNAELYQYNCVEFAEPFLYGKYLKNPSKYTRNE
jgi:hypothetical protein